MCGVVGVVKACWHLVWSLHVGVVAGGWWVVETSNGRLLIEA
jgi:hypothetical protein